MAKGAVHFPAGKPGNVLRGAFGSAFKRIACAETCSDARTCESRATCAYARVFEPVLTGGPSGLADAPRPFVFRVRHLDGRTIEPGERFHFDVNLFDSRDEIADCFLRAMVETGRLGIGRTRGQAVFEGADRPERRTVRLDARTRTVSGMRVAFLTPTELKSGDRIAERPEFGILFARVRDRLAMLSALYGSGPLPIDFAGLGERAAKVRMTRCEIEHVAVTRRSARTGQTHSLGGFVGSVEYEGDLAEFAPYLEAAQWTGVGRQTVWGKGEYAIRPG